MVTSNVSKQVQAGFSRKMKIEGDQIRTRAPKEPPGLGDARSSSDHEVSEMSSNDSLKGFHIIIAVFQQKDLLGRFRRARIDALRLSWGESGRDLPVAGSVGVLCPLIQKPGDVLGLGIDAYRWLTHAFSPISYSPTIPRWME